MPPRALLNRPVDQAGDLRRRRPATPARRARSLYLPGRGRPDPAAGPSAARSVTPADSGPPMPAGRHRLRNREPPANAPAPAVPARRTLAPSAPRPACHHTAPDSPPLDSRGPQPGPPPLPQPRLRPGRPLRPGDETAQSRPARPCERRRAASRAAYFRGRIIHSSCMPFLSVLTHPARRSHPSGRSIPRLIGYSPPPAAALRPSGPASEISGRSAGRWLQAENSLGAIPAILAGTWRDRTGPPRNPRSPAAIVP